MNVLLPAMIIYEKTHLGGFVSPLKRFERYFDADLSKSIFQLKNLSKSLLKPLLGEILTMTVMKVDFWVEKSI